MDIRRSAITIITLLAINHIVIAQENIDISQGGGERATSNQLTGIGRKEKAAAAPDNLISKTSYPHVLHLVDNGVAIDFYVQSISGYGFGKKDVILDEGEESGQGNGGGERSGSIHVPVGKQVVINFFVSDANTGSPISGRLPDSFSQHKPISGGKEERELSMKQCRFRAFKRSRMFEDHRPIMENTYVMCLNSFDNTISVIDPLLKPGFIAKTISLGEKGNELGIKEYGTDLYVTTESGKVVIIDCMLLEVVKSIDVGSNPYHIKFQPDGWFAWIGNDGDGTVSIIDTEKRSLVTNIEVGRGHHEVAFTDDSIYAYVTNRDDNSMTVIDVMRLLPLQTVKAGLRPYSPIYSRLSQCIYVANEGSGTVSVFDTIKQKVVDTIRVGRGVRGLKLDAEGRLCFALNRQDNSVSVIDVSRNSVIKTIPTGIRPESMVISTYYGYIRNEGSPDVTVIKMKDLSHLGEVPIGELPPNSVDIKEGHLDIGLSYMIVVPNPADDIVYTIMFGDLETAFKYKTGGRGPSKVAFYWTGLKEVSPGLYSHVLKFDEPGRHEIGFYIKSPDVAACFEVDVLPQDETENGVKGQ